MTAQPFHKDNCQLDGTKWHCQNVSKATCGLFFNKSTSNDFSMDSTTAFSIGSSLPTKLSSFSVTQKLSQTASGIMRLLRQISLDGNILRHSTFTKTFDQTEKLGSNFARHLSDTIALTTSLLTEIQNREQDAKAETAKKADVEQKAKKNKNTSPENVLKVLTELNSLIIYLIRLSSDSDKTQQKSNGKSKSKLRRQYSAFVESDQFRRIRRSLSRQDSLDGSVSSDSASSSPPKNDTKEVFDESQFVSQLGCTLEEAIRKLIDSQILSHLLEAIPKIGFEEKKMVRIIFTNSMILETNKNYLVVEYISDTSNGLLRKLIQSYEIGRSDVTLNCGAILRFATQYKSIVTAIFKSNLVNNFFEYMKTCPSNTPFDVSMDCSYSFKTILTRHKLTTISCLQESSSSFFDSLIQLLKYADETENYVTKRQTLEIFADIFSGSECDKLREQLVAQDCYICPIIVYLWDRNLQIRLRSLVLLNQLFLISKDGANVPFQTPSVKSESENDLEKSKIIPLNEDKETESAVMKTYWRIPLLVEKICQTRQRFLENGNESNVKSVESNFVLDIFAELRDECFKSNIKNFTSQLPFIDKVIDSINSINYN